MAIQNLKWIANLPASERGKFLGENSPLRVHFGDPQATQEHSVRKLRKMGIVGAYVFPETTKESK